MFVLVPPASVWRVTAAVEGVISEREHITGTDVDDHLTGERLGAGARAVDRAGTIAPLRSRPICAGSAPDTENVIL